MSKHEIRRLRAELRKVERRHQRQLLAFRRDTLHAVHHLIEEYLPVRDGDPMPLPEHHPKRGSK